MTAPKGNKNGVKLKDADIRQLAYRQYCDHIASGNSKDSWWFEHEQLTCTAQTFDKYIKDEVEFNPIHKEIAHAKGYRYWETIVHGSADGSNKEANTASLQMVMRNKFKWDKKEEEVEKSPELEAINENFKAFGAQITQLQEITKRSK